MSHDWTKEEAQIIKACWATEPGRLALNLIVERLCGLMGPADTDIEEGRRRVGIDLMRAINQPIDKLVKDNTHEPTRVVTATERAGTGTGNRRTAKPRTGR